MGASGSESPSERSVGRRRFLTRTLVASSAALALPTIVTVTPAGAITSPPPQPPTEVEPSSEAQPASEPAGTQVAAAKAQLPFTGADVEKLVVAGTAAIVSGAAMISWSAPKRPTTLPPPDEFPAG
ncbi:MAG TPA: hypothetical protein VGN59_19055 [Acidimicrobiia bacterium]